MHFAAVFAASVLQLFGKVIVAAQVKLHGVDVLVMTIEYDYMQSYSTFWRPSFLDCLNHTFHFGGGGEDSHFAGACSASILFRCQDANYFKLWNRTLPVLDNVVNRCPYSTTNRKCIFNKVNGFLKQFKMSYFMGHRNSSSVVTFLFADQNLNNNINYTEARWFVEWPNRLFLTLEHGYIGKETHLAKNGIALNHLLNFTTSDQCPEFTKYLQHLLCHDEDVEPTLFNCTETSTGSGICTEGKRYNVSKLLQANTICAKLLVDETPCDCPISSTDVPLALSSTTAKHYEDEGLSGSIIAAIVIGLIVALMVITGFVWFFVCRRRGASSRPVGAQLGIQAGTGADGSQAPPSQLAEGEGGASQKSVSKPPKSVSKQPLKTAKSVVTHTSHTSRHHHDHQHHHQHGHHHHHHHHHHHASRKLVATK